MKDVTAGLRLNSRTQNYIFWLACGPLTLTCSCQSGLVKEQPAAQGSTEAAKIPVGPASLRVAPSADAEQAGGEVSGQVARSAKLSQTKPEGQILFVVARDASTGGIVAVSRVEVQEKHPWPVPFTLKDRRLVPGAMVRLSARLDQDGSATSKQPGDEVGEVQLPVKVPETEVVLTLDQTL